MTPSSRFRAGPAWRGLFVALAVLYGWGISAPAWAQASVPWTPSAAARIALQRLVDDAGLELTVTQWPLPRRAVVQALDRLPLELEPALEVARARVRRELAQAAASALTLRLRGPQDELVGFGDDATPGHSLAVRSASFDRDGIAFQLGARLDASGGARGNASLHFDDSAVALERAGVQVQAWSHRSWWGPGWQDSLVLGQNAPALSGVGLQRASASRSSSPWLAWLGPWNLEMFVAQSEDVSVPANPFFVGQRLTFHPFQSLEIGLTRTAQWGGRGRPQSLHNFVNLLTGTGVNADTQAQQGHDPGNEMAGYDLRARCPSGVACAGYLQLIGEDRAGVWPSRYLGLYGVELWSGDGRHHLVAEYAETGCRAPVGRLQLRDCAYRNYAYPQGYTQGGRWLGAGIGPDSRVLSLRWRDTVLDAAATLNVGRIGSRIGRFAPSSSDAPDGGRLLGVSLQRGFAWGAATLTPEIAWQRLATPGGTRSDLRAGATLQMGLDAAFDSAAGSLGRSLEFGGAGGAGWRQALLPVGLVLGATLLDRPIDDHLRGRSDRPAARALTAGGDAVPVVGVGLAALSWALQRGSVQGDVAQAALRAGASALVAAEAGKFAIDRARPTDERGAADFGQVPRRESSFPSVHSAVAWAVLTPYAKHYDAPWLYGLAALTGAGRVAGREHWLSDTVAGAALGYALGAEFYRRSGAGGDPGVRLWISPRAVTFQMRY